MGERMMELSSINTGKDRVLGSEVVGYSVFSIQLSVGAL